MEKNLFELTDAQRAEIGIETLPKTLSEALDELEKDEILMNALGEHVAKQYIAMKRKECEDYAKRVTQWEIDNYLYKY